MTQEFKKGDRVKILRPAYVGEEGEFITYCGKVNEEKGCKVKLDIKDKQGKNVQEYFSVSELEKLS